MAHSDRRAERSRRILARFNIDLHDHWANGVKLDATTHAGVHTNKYYQYLEQAPERATTREDALGILDQVRRELLTGCRGWE